MGKVNTHHLTLVVFTCYHLQRLHDNEASYDRIGGGNGGNDISSHGYRRKEERVIITANFGTFCLLHLMSNLLFMAIL